MRIKLPDRFRFRESVTVDDPLGMGWSWTIRYFGNPDHIKYQREHGDSEQFSGLLDVVGKLQTAAAMEARSKNLKGKAAREYVLKRSHEIYLERINEIEMGNLRSAVVDSDALALHVVEKISGLQEVDEGTGEIRDIDSDIDQIKRVLTLTDPLPFEVEIVVGQGDDAATVQATAGTHIGVFYCSWVQAVSQDITAFNESALEQAGKDSPATSAGVGG